MHIGTAAARNIVPFTGELGGKGPLLVFADADLEAAARRAAGQYDDAGQVCLAGTRLLVEEGFAYHIDDYSDDFPYWDLVEMADGSKSPMVVLPYAIDSNDMKFWLAPSLTPQNWTAYAIDTFDQLYDEANELGARYMSLGLHLRIIGRPGRIGAFKAFLDHVKTRSDVWIASREEIAAAFAAAVPPPSV